MTTDTHNPKGILSYLQAGYAHVLRMLVLGLAFVAGAGILAMMAVTCIDVLMRRVHPLVGAFDIVKLISAVTFAAALPYTTAVKGHVAIEFFFHKFNRLGRIITDSILRILCMGLFGFLSYRSILYGNMLYKNGQTTQTLELPVFWVPYFIAFCSGLVVLVIGYNLLNPGREMIKP